MAKAKSQTSANSMDDVARPNGSEPSANSKSVIITSRPLMRDPMMAPDKTETTEATEAKTEEAAPVPAAKPANASVSHQLVLTPPTREPEAESAPEVTAKETVPAAEPAVAATPPATTPAVASREPELENSDVSINPDAAEDKAEEAEIARHAAIQKLVESQQYFLPVDHVELKRARVITAAGSLLILLLGLAWANIALDAGLVSVAGVPHTHFFKSTVTTVANVTPTASFKKYTAPQSKVSFKYPTSWEIIDVSASPASDGVNLRPFKKNAQVPITAFFAPYDTSQKPGAASFKVVDVAYQPFTTPDTAPYIQDLIYTDSAGRISVASSITRDKSVKVGDVLPSMYANYVNQGATKGFTFGLSAVHVQADKDGFASVDAARAALRSATYQQGRRILLSTVVPKQ